MTNFDKILEENNKINQQVKEVLTEVEELNKKIDEALENVSRETLEEGAK